METSRMLRALPVVLFASATLSFSQTMGTQTAPGSQQRSQHEMAQPGTVNYVEGQVSLNNQSLNAQQGASVMIQPGSTLATGNGFVEVLLTPGAYLRMGPNSEMRLENAGLANSQIQLDRGVADVEVDQLINGTHLTFAIASTNVQIEKKGLYDFNADSQSVRVLDGKVKVVLANGSKSIGKGDQLLLASEKPLKSKGFDWKAEKAQPLYVWSEARSRDEAQANIAIAQNVANYGGWYGAGWYWDPYWSLYAYLPGDGFLYSPFGLGFYSPGFIGYYGLPFGYGRYGRYGAWHGRVGGMNARVGGGFHSFAGGGGFHGGGGGRR